MNCKLAASLNLCAVSMLLLVGPGVVEAVSYSFVQDPNIPLQDFNGVPPGEYTTALRIPYATAWNVLLPDQSTVVAGPGLNTPWESLPLPPATVLPSTVPLTLAGNSTTDPNLMVVDGSAYPSTPPGHWLAGTLEVGNPNLSLSGALTILFDVDQSVFGTQIFAVDVPTGGNLLVAGKVYAYFFGRDGGLIDTPVTVLPPPGDTLLPDRGHLTFKSTTPFAAVILTTDDNQGLWYYGMQYTPVPATAFLLIPGLVVLHFRARGRRLNPIASGARKYP